MLTYNLHIKARSRRVCVTKGALAGRNFYEETADRSEGSSRREERETKKFIIFLK